MEEAFDKLIYQRGNKTKEAKSIDLKVPNDMTCKEFRIICIRMAHALGYHEENVRETFGKVDDANKESDKKQLKLLFD
tara:strand:- start:169 stop:402 length:234 start_codon:yes stop_codon:yes gene_type:complete